MPITAHTLYRDMLRFFRNQFASISLLALLTALISLVLAHALSPSSAQLMTLSDHTRIGDTTDITIQQLIRQMSLEQQSILLKASAANTLAALVSNVLLIGGLLTMIRLVSNREPVSVLRAIWLSAPLFPRLLVLIFLTTLLVQLGLMLIIVPGILLAILLSLAPVIASSDNIGAIKSMRLSISLAFINIRLLAPAVLFWLLAKASVLSLATKFTLASAQVAETVFLNSINNLISALLLIYLYRLYMLLRQT